MKKERTYFADSSYLIDLTREKSEALDIQEDNSIITGLIGVYELGKLSDLTVEQIRAGNQVETVNSKDIQKAVNIYGELKAKGEMINQLNILIAAQSINRDMTLLTTDEDFEKIEGLKTRYYRDE